MDTGSRKSSEGVVVTGGVRSPWNPSSLHFDISQAIRNQAKCVLVSSNPEARSPQNPTLHPNSSEPITLILQTVNPEP